MKLRCKRRNQTGIPFSPCQWQAEQDPPSAVYRIFSRLQRIPSPHQGHQQLLRLFAKETQHVCIARVSLLEMIKPCNNSVYQQCKWIYLQVKVLNEWIIGIYLHVFTNNEREISIPHSRPRAVLKISSSLFRGWSRGRVQGMHTPTPWDEAFFIVFAFKICLPHRSVTSFLGGAPPPKKNPGSAPVVSYSEQVILIIRQQWVR